MTIQEHAETIVNAWDALKNQGVIGIQNLLSGNVQFHIYNKEQFKAIPGEVTLVHVECRSGDYHKFVKRIGGAEFIMVINYD